MNYPFEMFIYGVSFIVAQLYICIVAISDIRRRIEKYYRKKLKVAWLDSEESRSINKKSERICNGVTYIQVLLLILTVYNIPCKYLIFPTPIAGQAAYVTTEGAVVRLPYGAWTKDLPKNTVIVRLEDTFSLRDCPLNTVQGHTYDDLLVQVKTGLWGIEFKAINYEKFYTHYKQSGYDGLCRDLQETLSNQVFVHALFYPNNSGLIGEGGETTEEAQSIFRKRILQLFTEKFQDNGIVPVME